MSQFPEGFLWGASTSAHQIEGGNFASDWWRWEQRPGRICEEATSRVAADHYNRFEADFELARKLGHNAHLLTLEWSRIQPAAGTFDEHAIEHYAAVLDALQARGLEPVCALTHATLPAWFAEKHGWLNARASRLFERYARRVAEALAPRCRWWIPILEPQYAADQSYLWGAWPPGCRNPRRASCAAWRQALAHASAYRALHAVRPGARVGVSVRAQVFEPHDPESAWDLRCAQRETRRALELMPRAVTEGVWPWVLGKDPRLKRTADFIGMSFFGIEKIRFSAARFRERCVAPCADGAPAAQARSSPAPFAEALRTLARYELPILVTGNGIAAEDDARRCAYLLDHLSVLGSLIEEGLPLAGYIHRALLDGFEWTAGYTERYGLIHVDWETLARTPNPSAYLYKDICTSGQVRPGTISRFCAGWTPPVELPVHEPLLSI